MLQIYLVEVWERSRITAILEAYPDILTMDATAEEKNLWFATLKDLRLKRPIYL